MILDEPNVLNLVKTISQNEKIKDVIVSHPRSTDVINEIGEDGLLLNIVIKNELLPSAALTPIHPSLVLKYPKKVYSINENVNSITQNANLAIDVFIQNINITYGKK